MEGHCEQKCNLIAIFIPFDRPSIILSLVTLHWFIPLWHFTFIRTSVETASHWIVTNVRP